MLDGAAEQLGLPLSALAQERHYRVGPASKPVSDPVYVENVLAFQGNGLRPFAPVHLKSAAQSNGDAEISWIRRTRVGGDSWDVPEIPLNEESELYRLQVWSSDDLLFEDMFADDQWTYSAALQTAHGVEGVYEIRVAQVSAIYGIGPDTILHVAAG